MDKEKVQIWASIAEVISAIAVVLTLIYVVYEVRNAETLSNRDIEVLLYERQADWNRSLAENTDLVDVVIKARTDLDSLTDGERMRAIAFDVLFYDTWELAYGHQSDGILSESTWLEWNKFFTMEVQRRPKSIWKEISADYSDAFVMIVDEALGKELNLR